MTVGTDWQPMTGPPLRLRVNSIARATAVIAFVSHARDPLVLGPLAAPCGSALVR